MIFYLGTHVVNWLWTKEDNIPLFVSDTTLRKYKKLKPANFIWALDSGGYSELHKHGRWTVPPKDYADRVSRYDLEIGNLQFAAIQDWMCEPSVRKKTGKSVGYHQKKTIESFWTLKPLAPSINWLPVLQGQAAEDYLNHLKMYRDSGWSGNHFGLGSVCRRASSDEIIKLVTLLHSMGIEIHGFGVKTTALDKVGHLLSSADSLAWSSAARWEGSPKYPTCLTHKNCANCYSYAKYWYRKQLKRIV